PPCACHYTGLGPRGQELDRFEAALEGSRKLGWPRRGWGRGVVREKEVGVTKHPGGRPVGSGNLPYPSWDIRPFPLGCAPDHNEGAIPPVIGAGAGPE